MPRAEQQPYQLQYPSPGPHLPFTNSVISTYPTDIFDIRPLVGTAAAAEISIETTGFGLVPAESAKTEMRYDDWYDEAKIKSVYYKEVEECVLRLARSPLEGGEPAADLALFPLQPLQEAVRRIQGHHLRPHDPARREAGRGDARHADEPQADSSRCVHLSQVQHSSSSLTLAPSAVHVDQTPESGRRRVLRHGGEDGEKLLRGASCSPSLTALLLSSSSPLASFRRALTSRPADGLELTASSSSLAGRAQLINTWKPLRGPVRDMPLAFADARTLDTDKDLVRARLLYPTEGEFAQPEGETLTVKYNPAHKWYYLSEMGPDEGASLLSLWLLPFPSLSAGLEARALTRTRSPAVLLLKCWESLPDGKIGTITPHTAFHDERFFGKEGVELRESIEVRALVFHEVDE